MVGFALVGLQHGAFDFALIKKRGGSLAVFLVGYLGIAFSFLVLVRISPIAALGLFLILSAIHFGQELLPESGVGISTALGAAVIMTSFAANSQQAWRLIENFTGLRSAGSDDVAAILIFQTATLLAVALTQTKRKTAEVAALLLGLWLLPIWIGFGLFFVYWHSLDSFIEQRIELGLTAKRALAVTAPLSIGAAIILLFGFAHSKEMAASFVAAISVGHILTRPLLDHAALKPSARERATAIQ